MRYDELSLFTHEELSSFTNAELEMLPADLMRKILDSNNPLPPSVALKLNKIIEQANNQISDPKKKIKKMVSEKTTTIELCKLLVSIVAHAPALYDGFTMILDTLFG